MSDRKNRVPIGQLLKEKGLINENHISYVLQEQKITREMIGELLERMGFVTSHDLVMSLSEQWGVPYMDVNAVVPDEASLKLFNKNLCLNNIFLPVKKIDRNLEIAAYDISDDRLGQLIYRQSGLKPTFYLSEKNNIINAVNRLYYFLENPIEKLIDTEVRILSQDVELARGMDKLIRYLFHLAVKMRATDIHIRPMRKVLNISFRVDGVMTSVMSLPPSMMRMIASIKLRADMDIAEQRVPQDGRFSEEILNNRYDLRASTVVVSHGENIVLRVLPAEGTIMGMNQLGFSDEHIDIVEKIFNEPFGIILLTGPTGSGKSTTLYAGIRRLNLLEKNVITVEEPIEYEIPLLRQTQVNDKAGYTFADAIRYFLRHDPDVILVGEIRDAETAAIAVTASTTGHLVLSTLHTNNALGVIPRLKDLGIRPYLISDSLIGVVNQRLVRKICSNCMTSYTPSDWEKAYLKDNTLKELYRGEGCEVCNGSGYFDRTLVYELLMVNRDLARLIGQEANMNDINEVARKVGGYVDIFDVTADKIKQGISTTEEAVRILGNIRQN